MEFKTVIDQCNKFDGNVKNLWAVRIADNSEAIGYMLPSFVKVMDWPSNAFQFDGENKTITLKLTRVDDAVASASEQLLKLAQANSVNLEKSIGKWLLVQKDFHPIGGMDDHLKGIQIPSPLRGIVGIITRGVHMNMYTYKMVDSQDELHIWVSKRSANVTYPNKLDQLVAGAMNPEDNMDPLITLGREANEEAGITLDRSTLVMSYQGQPIGAIKQGSSISFYDKKDHTASNEEGHLEPGIRFTYDIKVASDFVPIPNEPEAIDGFVLKSVREVKKDLKNAEWKPNCGLVMLDFLMRMGEIVGKEDGSYEVLSKGLRRELPFKRL